MLEFGGTNTSLTILAAVANHIFGKGKVLFNLIFHNFPREDASDMWSTRKKSPLSPKKNAKKVHFFPKYKEKVHFRPEKHPSNPNLATGLKIVIVNVIMNQLRS